MKYFVPNTPSRAKSTGIAIVMTLAASFLLAGAAIAGTHGPGVQTVVNGSVNDVLKSMNKMVAANGMMVMGELHQGKVLKMTGLKVQSESIFVGNPTVGKKLFSADAGAGIAVPVRINIYENAKGQTIVSYIPLSQQLSDFDNPKIDKIAGMLDGKLSAMVKMLAK